MNYFLDTEFNEKVSDQDDENPPTIELISLAIVTEPGVEYYWESADFDSFGCNAWVKENVLPKLNPPETRRARCAITKEVLELTRDDPAPVFWAEFGSYDWVVFCWLFGTMEDIPPNFPYHPMDLQQWWVQLGKPDIKPPPPKHEHHALHDARWNREFYKALCLNAKNRDY
jgi:hypothetical protein